MWLHSLIRLYRKEKQESAHRYARSHTKEDIDFIIKCFKETREEDWKINCYRIEKCRTVQNRCPAFCDDITEKFD